MVFGLETDDDDVVKRILERLDVVFGSIWGSRLLINKQSEIHNKHRFDCHFPPNTICCCLFGELKSVPSYFY